MSRITSLKEFIEINYLVSKFLVCGTLKADLPYQKVKEVREKNRRLGLGLTLALLKFHYMLENLSIFFYKRRIVCVKMKNCRQSAGKTQ